MSESSTSYLTLSRLQELVRQALDDSFPFPVWVSAEIGELKVNYSGHCYLELVEKGGANAVPKARMAAVIWRSSYGAIDSYFRSAAGISLRVGIRILVKGNIVYHDVYGMSLQIVDIDPLYTLGDMERQRQETVRRLKEEGVWEMNRELGMPDVVQRLAVVSSRGAAGYRDFMKEIGASPYRFEVELFDAFVQGERTEQSVIDALGRVAEEIDRFDAVVLIRGGGAQSDLACFNAYRLCAHLAQFPLPVLAGIGHDKDRSVADEVAALSLKTPTAVAGWLVDRMAENDGRLAAAAERLAVTARGNLAAERRALVRQGETLARIVQSGTRTAELRLERLRGEIAGRARRAIERQAGRLDEAVRLLPDRTRTFLERCGNSLDKAEVAVNGRRPERILALGFALVRKEGVTLRDARQAGPGDAVEITLAAGTLQAKITSHGKE